MSQELENRGCEGARRKGARLHGEYSFKIDSKGRLAVPAPFRKVLEDTLVMTLDLEEQCILVFNPADYDEWVDTLFEKRFGGYDESSRTHVALRRKLDGRAKDIPMDKSGRLVVPTDFCDKIGVSRPQEVSVVGTQSRFEIWNTEAFHAEDELVELSMLRKA